MKNVFPFLFLFFAANVFAQKETFDLTTYTPPKAWKKEKTEGAIQFSKEDAEKGTYCLIALYKAVPGTANSKEKFDLAWASLVKEMVTVSTPPEMQPSATENGWETQSGLAPFESDGTKGVVLLVTASAVDKMANLIVVTNTDVYEKEITAFLESVSLKKPATALQQNNTETNTQTASSLTNYVWKSHQNRKDAMGNNAGYSTNSYQFYSNGTYKFSNTTFQYYTPKYYMVNEEGTYQINGKKITLKPVKSKFDVRQREKTDPVSKSGNFNLEVVQYSFEYTTVYDRLRLVLVPGNQKETKRDGIFNYYVNGEKTKSYLYDAEGALSTQTTTKPTVESPIQSSGAYAFTTTNFDDGWISNAKEDWVEVTKGNLKVLIHYPNKLADDYNPDLLGGLKNAWNVLVAPKYSSAVNMEFKPLHNWESIEFAEADMVEKATGKTVHVVLFQKNFSGGGKYLEFITHDKRSFEREFGAYSNEASAPVWDKIAAMANYNKFAVAASDLKGKWTSNFTGMTQYVNAYTGASAGADTHASNENFEFGAGNTYKWDLGVASGFIGNIKFQSVKSNGKFSVLNNWQVSFSDIEGKPKTYNVQFVCIKGARVLWIGETGFGKKE